MACLCTDDRIPIPKEKTSLGPFCEHCAIGYVPFASLRQKHCYTAESEQTEKDTDIL